MEETKESGQMNELQKIRKRLRSLLRIIFLVRSNDFSRCFVFLGLCFITAACTPASPTSLPPKATLPQPQVHVYQATVPLPTPTAVQHQATALPSLSPTAIPQTPAELARAMFGERLIVQVVIPVLDLVAPVVPLGWSPQDADTANPETTWDSPEAQVGWVLTSALPGNAGGVTLLYGHNNIQSSVFKRLYELQSGNEVKLVTGERTWLYRVSETHLLPVKGIDPADYAAFLRAGRLPRLVLISCWPPLGNSHRVIVVAELAGR